MRRWRVTLIGLPVLALASVTGCTSAADESTTTVPSSTTVDTVPVRSDFVVEYEVSGSVTTLSLSFPDEPERGEGWTLERWDGAQATWELVGWLTTGEWGTALPPTFAAPPQTFVWRDRGIGGPGPDLAEVPFPLDPAAYRICERRTEDFCATFEVSVPDG